MWLDDEIGVVVCDGKVIAAVVPLQMMRKLRGQSYGSGGNGGSPPGTGLPPGTTLPPVDDGPFDAHFAEAFDGVLSSVRPDFVPALLRAKVHAS